MSETKESMEFGAEVGKVLNFMIHSIYTNKDIFLRELISNSSDACDKLKYLSQTDNEILGSDSDLKIEVSVNKEKKEIIVSDNGIGMNRQDLIENLGTIARSGTQSFFDKLTGDAKKDNNLIGQFGVGFYSSFMLADKVTVISRKAKEEKSYIWESDGAGKYYIDEYKDEFSRGTKIILHVKEGDEAFLDHFKLKYIIKTYSDHICVPIFFTEENGTKNQLNSSSALWMKPKAEISEQAYKDFYKNIAYSQDDPWIILHNKNEGMIQFTNLLFIPSTKTFDLFHPDRKRRLKLYIKRVFITDENVEIIPQYLRFLRGVVDSEDLPLNISRETLQHNTVLEKIKQAIINKVFSELEKKKDTAREEYINFWQNFGAVIKEGLCEGLPDHEKLLKICLFRNAIKGEMITLDEYIKAMQPGQKNIYYLSGEDYDKLKNSPQIEGFIKRNIDVLLFTDTVDDFWVNVVRNYGEFELKSVTRADIDPDEIKDEDKAQEQSAKGNSQENYEDIIKFFKETLENKVKEVKISKKLYTSPVCLAVGEGSMDIRMERFLIEQKQLMSSSAKILELNPNHKIIQKIAGNIKDKINLEESKDLVHILFDQACILEGEPVKDTGKFSSLLNKMLEKAI